MQVAGDDNERGQGLGKSVNKTYSRSCSSGRMYIALLFYFIFLSRKQRWRCHVTLHQRARLVVILRHC